MTRTSSGRVSSPKPMLPASIVSRPAISRSSVLLPQPLRPTIATNCPAGICRSMPRSTSLSPNDLRKPRMVSGRPREAASGPRRASRACSMKSGRSTGSASGGEKTKGFLHGMSHVFLEGRMPGQRQPLQRARGAVGELSEQGVDQDAEHDDVDQHEFARLHRHVAEARRRRDGLRHDQRQPHDAEREAQADEDRRQRARKDHAAEQFAVAHAVDAAHLDQLRIDGADAVQRVEIDRKEHAERDQKQFGGFVDAEPQDDERNQRQMRNVAHHLQRRVGQFAGELRQAVGKPEGKADAAADDEADARAPEADPDVALEFARQQQLPARQRHVASAPAAPAPTRSR